MEFDIVIIGGSFAGQAAALQLARARRRVLLVDARKPRNRFAATSHGFLGQDGRRPSAIIETAAQQLTAYPTVTAMDATAELATKIAGGFRISLASGQAVTTQRVILATGVRDILPDMPGLAERWGHSVLHCPYCHGYELDQRPIGVLASGPMAFHQAMLVPDWGPTTLFTQETFFPDDNQLAQLESRGVTVERTPIVSLFGDAPSLSGVRLADGRSVGISGLFIAPRTEPVGNLAGMLGCAFEEGPTGPFVTVNPRQQTTVSGVFAAGDAASPMANATLSTAAGLMAANSAHHSLIFTQH